MYLFFLILLILYIFSWFQSSRKGTYSFSKQTTLYLKGICSILIIACHMASNTQLGFLLPFKPWGAPIVSIFLFISGYGLMASYQTKGGSYLKGFFHKRVWKILMPYLVVTILFLIFYYFDQENLSMTIVLDRFILKGIPPLPYSWFVITIIILYIFFYWVFRISCLSLGQKIFWSIVLSCLYIAITILIGYDRNWWVSTLGFCAGMFYRYKESFFITHSQNRLWKIGFMPICSILIFVISLSPIECFLSLAYIFIPLVVVMLVSYYTFSNNKVLAFLGNISYEIYLFHGACFALLRGNVIYIQSDYIYAFCVFFLTIFLANLLHRGLSYINKY